MGWGGGLRSSSAALGSIYIFEQKRIVVRYDNPDAESAAKEENKEAPNKRGESSVHQFTRVLCLASCHGDELGTDHTA